MAPVESGGLAWIVSPAAIPPEFNELYVVTRGATVVETVRGRLGERCAGEALAPVRTL